MNIQPHDRIMLVDGQTKYNLEHNPSYEKLFRDFKICEKENLLGSELVRENHHQVAITESQDNRFYAPSLLYQNLYYPLERYDEMYQKDLNRLIYEFMLYMGAKNVRFFNYEYHCHIESTTFEAKLQADITKGVNLINLSAACSQQSTNEKEKSQWREIKYENRNQRAWSKEELNDWITQERICIGAIPFEFSTLIKNYLKTGEVSGKLEKTETISSTIKENAELGGGLSLALPMLPNFIGGTLTANYHKTSEYRYLSQIKYEIEF